MQSHANEEAFKHGSYNNELYMMWYYLVKRSYTNSDSSETITIRSLSSENQGIAQKLSQCKSLEQNSFISIVNYFKSLSTVVLNSRDQQGNVWLL